MEKPKNPKAFPLEYKNGSFETGMDLRDYFAAKAMQAMITNGEFFKAVAIAYKEEKDNEIYACLSKEAFSVADAMLKEREKK